MNNSYTNSKLISNNNGNGIIRLMADQNQRSVNDPGVVQLISPFINNLNASGTYLCIS